MELLKKIFCLLYRLRSMQKKIRELKDILQKAGFIHHSTKGSHTRLVHPLLKNEPITITGKDEDKIKTYMAKEVSHHLRSHIYGVYTSRK